MGHSLRNAIKWVVFFSFFVTHMRRFTLFSWYIYRKNLVIVDSITGAGQQKKSKQKEHCLLIADRCSVVGYMYSMSKWNATDCRLLSDSRIPISLLLTVKSNSIRSQLLYSEHERLKISIWQRGINERLVCKYSGQISFNSIVLDFEDARDRVNNFTTSENYSFRNSQNSGAHNINMNDSISIDLCEFNVHQLYKNMLPVSIEWERTIESNCLQTG